MLAEQGLAIPLIEAWNKWDILDEDARENLVDAMPRDRTVCPISALTGEGVSALLRAASNALVISHRVHKVHLARHDGQKIAWLHAHGDVLAEDEAGDSNEGPMRRLTVRLNPKELGQFASLS